jgi:hypothetical protein
MTGKQAISRREFLEKTAEASFAIAAGLPLGGGRQKKRSTVVLIRHPDVVDEKRRINGKIVQQMLDEAMMALFQCEDPVSPWKKILKPDDVVGVKSNVWGPLPTPKELEEAIVRRVRDVGVKGSNISVDDRGVLRNPVFRRATALINTRPMRTHHWAGVGSCVKNYIMFTKNPPDYHPDSCANLAALWNLPIVKGKTRLNILVMFTPLFHGIGPHHFDLKYTWRYCGMILGTDPVAVDAVGLRIIQLRRREYFKKEKPLWPPAKHIGLAETRFGLGVADLRRIEIIKLGWKEGMLI